MEVYMTVIGFLAAQTGILTGIFYKLGGLETRVSNLEKGVN
jgi:hypothetical protein